MFTKISLLFIFVENRWHIFHCLGWWGNRIFYLCSIFSVKKRNPFLPNNSNSFNLSNTSLTEGNKIFIADMSIYKVKFHISIYVWWQMIHSIYVRRQWIQLDNSCKTNFIKFHICLRLYTILENDSIHQKMTSKDTFWCCYFVQIWTQTATHFLLNL